MNKRIALLARSLETGGAERQLVATAIELKRHGWLPVVLVFYRDGALARELVEAGIEYIELGKYGRWDVFRFLLTLFREIKRLKPQIVYSFLSIPNIVASIVCLPLRQPKVVWGIRNSALAKDYGQFLTKLVFWLERRFALLPALVIANSDSAIARFRELRSESKPSLLIYNGIDIDYFVPAPQARENARRRWRLPNRGLVVGIVARLDPLKDHQTFLRAVKMLCDRKFSATFVIVGAGDKYYEDMLRQEADVLDLSNDIFWLGEIRDMPLLYSMLDMLVLTSASEGFPNVLAEAMSCGVPCVSTDVGEAKTIIGDYGLIVPPRDAAALAEAIVHSADRVHDPSMIRNHIVNNFSVAKMGALLDHALTRTIAPSAGD